MASGNITKYANGTDSGWVTYEGTADDQTDLYTGKIHVRRIGNIVEVTFESLALKENRTASSWYTIETIASQFRPPDGAYCSVNSRGRQAWLTVYINSAGNIRVGVQPDGNGWSSEDYIYMTMVYFV